MQRGTHTIGGRVDRTRMRFGVRDQFRQRGRWQRRMNGDYEHAGGDAADRGEVPVGVVRQLSIDDGEYRQDGGGAKQNGVAIARGSGDVFRGNDAAGAWFVIEYDRLTKKLSEFR